MRTAIYLSADMIRPGIKSGGMQAGGSFRTVPAPDSDAAMFSDVR